MGQTAVVMEEKMMAVIPKTMRAAVYRGVNDVRVETVPVPEIGRGEVLVKIACCGICGTDLKKIHSGSHSAPRIFGHEMAGTVAAVGDGVTQWKVGDRVMAFHHQPCGDCFYCRKETFAQCELYKKVGCTAGFEPAGGGFAEYIRVMDWIAPRGLVRVPDDVPFEQAIFIEPVNTTLKAVKNLNLKSDETVLVIGQGPIGIMLAALAAREGAKVVTSDLYEQRHKVAAQYGLKHPIMTDKEAMGADVIEAAKAASDGRGVDVTLIAVGGNALIKTALDSTRCGGTVVLFAQTQRGDAIFDPAVVCMDEKTLMGSYSSSATVQDEGARVVLEGYKDGFNLVPLISHRFGLEQAVEAIEFASTPHADSMKIVIDMQA
jgi:L-iditol 2-dehydrogenase